MDLEDGVRLGSLCADGGSASRRASGTRCPVAANVIATLDAAAEATSRAAESPLCLFTSLTEAYVEGHEVFVRTALLSTPSLSVPMFVLGQSLTNRSRARVEACYAHTRWASVRASPKDVARVTKFALNKEKIALFGLHSQCAAVLKIDTGDMLVVGGGLRELLTHRAVEEAATGRSRTVWATQAMGQPDGKINGGLMLFGRYWLHEATEDALEACRARPQP